MPIKEIPLWERKLGKIAIRTFVELTSKGFIVEGKDNLPEKPPYIIAFNHVAWVEGLLPQIILPVKEWPYTITKIENFHGILGKFLQEFGFIGIHRGENDMVVQKIAQDILNSGHVLSTAPEGTRGKDEQRLEIKTGKGGVIFLSTYKHDSPIPIIPMAIWGQNELTLPFPEKGVTWSDIKRLRQSPQFVRFGEPFIPQIDSKSEEKLSTQYIREANILMQKIASLLPPDHVNNYSQG